MHAGSVHRSLGTTTAFPLCLMLLIGPSVESSQRGLIQINGLSDSVTNDAVGSFINPTFSKLYVELIEVGSRSLNDAHKVAVKIQKMDIKDLEESLAQVSNSNVRRAYQNLLRASQNHLRAFSSQLGHILRTFQS